MVLYRIPLIYLGVTSECPLKGLKHPLSAERPLETSNTTAGQSPRKQYSDDGSCQVTSSSLDPQEVTPHSSAAVPQEVTPHSSAAVPQEVTPHSSAAVPQEVTPHSSAAVPQEVTPHSSAAVPQEVTPHSSAAVPQEVTPHSSAAVPQEVTPHSSAAVPQEVTPHSSAAVPQEVTPHSSAAVPQEVTPHSSAAVPQEVIPHSSAVVPDPVLDTNEDFNTEAVTQERVASFISSPIFHDFLHDQCDVRRIATKLHSLGAISRDELDNMGPLAELRKANSSLYLSLAKDSNVIQLQLVSKALQFDALHENHQMLAKRINKFVKGMYIFQK